MIIHKLSQEPALQFTCEVQGDRIQNTDLKPSKEGLILQIKGQPRKDLQDTVVEWLKAYALGKQPAVVLTLNLDLLPPFTAQILAFVRKIPFGETYSYGEIAVKMGNPKAARAVGNACGRNPFPLFIPCHRVLAANRRIGGFSCDPQVKKILLSFEGISCL